MICSESLTQILMRVTEAENAAGPPPRERAVARVLHGQTVPVPGVVLFLSLFSVRHRTAFAWDRMAPMPQELSWLPPSSAAGCWQCNSNNNNSSSSSSSNTNRSKNKTVILSMMHSAKRSRTRIPTRRSRRFGACPYSSPLARLNLPSLAGLSCADLA